MLTLVQHLHELFQRTTRDDEGVTAVEYALIAALIAVAIIAAVTLLGGTISNVFSHVSSAASTTSTAN